MNGTPATAGSDPLMDYANAWILTAAPIPTSVFAGCTRVGNFSGLVLDRRGDCQIQLWIADPNADSGDHAHPTVDSIQIFLSGKIDFWNNGDQVLSSDESVELADGTSSQNGAVVRTRAGMVHRAKFGDTGGSFLNVQRWAAGSPTSVEADWEGEPMTDAHSETVDQSHFYKKVFGMFDFEDIYDRAASMANDKSILVEVGSFFGKSSCYLAQKLKEHGKHATLYCVDPFLGFNYEPGKERFEAHFGVGATTFTGFVSNITSGGYRDIIVPVACPSVDAAKLFAADSVDFVFIDGRHDYEFVKEDILAWLPKLKAGGIIAGHDWGAEVGVEKAVQEIFGTRFVVSVHSWVACKEDAVA